VEKLSRMRKMLVILKKREREEVERLIKL